MPTYEYVCEKCEKEFEVFQSMKDDALTECPENQCGGEIRRKLSGGAGLIFKGSGFYTTDYRSESYKSSAKADATAGASTPAPSPPPSTGGSGPAA